MSQSPKAVVLPSREAINSMQVTNLLNILGVASSCLTRIVTDVEDEKRGGANDGGALMAAETTIINVCARLDAMLEEAGRWTLDSQNTLEAQLSALYVANTGMLNAQKAAYDELNSPHARLKPVLLKLGPSEWLAFCGDARNLDNAIVGMGGCPAEAIDAFDAIFKGEVPEHLKAFLAAREAAVAQGQPGTEWTDFQNNKNKNEKHKIEKLDPQGTKDSPRMPRKRRDSPRNRREDESDTQGS